MQPTLRRRCASTLHPFSPPFPLPRTLPLPFACLLVHCLFSSFVSFVSFSARICPSLRHLLHGALQLASVHSSLTSPELLSGMPPQPRRLFSSPACSEKRPLAGIPFKSLGIGTHIYCNTFMLLKRAADRSRIDRENSACAKSNTRARASISRSRSSASLQLGTYACTRMYARLQLQDSVDVRQIDIEVRVCHQSSCNCCMRLRQNDRTDLRRSKQEQNKTGKRIAGGDEKRRKQHTTHVARVGVVRREDNDENGRMPVGGTKKLCTRVVCGYARCVCGRVEGE